MRYFIHLAYNGTRFHGWQIQPNAMSIQECLHNCLSQLLQEPIQTIGAGRTDTGVHASSYYAHFETSKNINTQDICYKLNKIVSNDIVIYSIFEVADDCHARFSAVSRTYIYSITQIKNPFRTETSYYFPYTLNIEKMNEAALILLQYSDFTSFSKLHTDVNNNNCSITFAEWTTENNQLQFTISANRFLRNMVRSITGTLIDIGQGKTTLDEFRQIIESKNRQNAGKSIPAHGLCLTHIDYGDMLRNLHI